MSRYEMTDSAGVRYACGWTGETYYANKSGGTRCPYVEVPFSQNIKEFGEAASITDVGTFISACRAGVIEIPPNVILQLINDKYHPGQVNVDEVNLQGWECVEREKAKDEICSVCASRPCRGLHPKTLFEGPGIFEVNYPDGIIVRIYRDKDDPSDPETIDVDVFRLGSFLGNMRLPL